MRRSAPVLSVLIVLFFVIPFFSHGENIPAVTADSFNFAILGDRAGGPDQAAFERVVQQMAMLHPDFVVTVGDLVDNAEKAEDYLVPLETLSRFSCPIYHAAGNNDIHDEKTAAIFTEQTGFKPYYSFDVGSSHFVICNNAMARTIDGMGTEQLAWLEADLTKYSESRTKFVFMHKPFWSDGVAAGKPDRLHDLFRKTGVTAVFTGHWHQTAYGEFDGIRYYVVGSSGAEYSGKENVDLGFFHQFFWCTVRSGKLSVSIVKPGCFYPEDLVTIEEEKLAYRIPEELIAVKGTIVGDGGNSTTTVTISITNDTDLPLTNPLSLVCGENSGLQSITSQWQLMIPPADTSTVTADLSLSKGLFPLPRLMYDYVFGREKVYSMNKPLSLTRIIPASLAKHSPKIDGSVDDACWQKAIEIHEFCDSEGQPAAVGIQSLTCLHTKKDICFAIHCTDPPGNDPVAMMTDRDAPVYRDDSVGFIFFPGERYIYQLYINSRGVVWDARIDMKTGEYAEDFTLPITVATASTEEGWIIECRIPKKSLEIANETDRIPFNIRRKCIAADTSAFLLPLWNFQRRSMPVLDLSQH